MNLKVFIKKSGLKIFSDRFFDAIMLAFTRLKTQIIASLQPEDRFLIIAHSLNLHSLNLKCLPIQHKEPNLLGNFLLDGRN